MPPNGLHAALVLSRKAHARILSMDDSGAKSSPGFRGFFMSKDVPGSNKLGPVIYDEELFASEFVTCVGQVWISRSHIKFFIVTISTSCLLFYFSFGTRVHSIKQVIYFVTNR